MSNLIIIITVSLASFTIGVLGWMVYLRNQRSVTNKTFLFFSLISICWNLSNFFAYQVDSQDLSFWFIRLNMFFAVWYSFYLLKLFHYFLASSKKTIRYFKIIFLLAIIISLITLTPLVLHEVKSYGINGKISTIENGPAIPIFGIFVILLIITAILKIITRIKKSASSRKQQLIYVLIGTSITFGLYIIFNLIFPAVFNNSKYVQLSSVFTLPFIILTSYSIIKHRLLGIRLVLFRTVTYSLLVIFISATVVVITLLLPEILNFDTTAKTIIAIITSILIVLILDPLKKWIGFLTDKLFFKASVNYKKLLADLSEIINREIDMDRLLFLMAKKVENEIKLKNVSIYLSSNIGGAFYKRKGRVDKNGKKITIGNTHEMNDHDEHNFKSRLSHDNPLIGYLQESNDIIVLEALERKIEDTQDDKFRKKLESSKKSLDELDAEVVAPVNVNNNLTAVMVFGPKLSGDPFGSEDIELFKLIGPQLASALEKSRLYEEAKQFTERLKKEVALATEHLRNTNVQLQERNRFLAALQKVTSLMTQTLDFNKVTQSIADSISSELGYLGGIVMFLGKDRHKLFPDAVTQTPIIKKSLKLLPKPFSELYGDFRKGSSRSIIAIKEGKVQIGNDLNDFIDPAIPKSVSKDIQKLVGIKTIVAIPIFSGSKSVGVIDFLLNEDAEQIKEIDLSIMKALANQTGIVSSNIELYKQVQDSNKELAEANTHLQQLDQAKSEFVSITSHQLRTPMTGIMGYLSMILQGDFGKVPKEQNKILTELLEESQRMIRIINLFLNVSKIESGKMELNFEEVQIEDVVERVVDMVQQAADEKGLKLIYKKPDKPLPKVWGDKDKLGDIILNFTDNAIKYTEKGTVKLITEVQGKYLHFAVKDTGRGLDPEEAKKLFTKFVRGFGIAQVNPDGSGLGLYVARRLTEAHQGEIWVDSEGVGKGSIFQVTIPLFNGQKVEKPKK